jgi:siderophore synthetase component
MSGTTTTWDDVNRALCAKALGELAHERVLAPEEEGDMYAISSDDGEVTWRFEAERLALDHWAVDPASVEREPGEVSALTLVADLRATLDLDDERLGLYLEEITATLAAAAFKRDNNPPDAATLARADFQTIETTMSEGHPCFIANSGRLGWSADDYLAHAPEAAQPTRLVWVAAHRDHATFAGGGSPDALLAAQHEDPALAGDQAALLATELDDETRESFVTKLPSEDYILLPVHPWQWRNRIAVTFADDLARGRLVHLGEGPDQYLAQQSIRTFFNTTNPTKDYVKTALSVVNMGFVRGLSAKYMEGTPAINAWVADLVHNDETLRGARFEVLQEHAAGGFRSPVYARAGDAAPYAKMLAALWRESPVPRLQPGERAATMAALLHHDAHGRSLAAALIEQSGETPRAWLDAYLNAYMMPLLHCFFAHDLVFMPHGENIILVLDEAGVPRRVFLKDIGEEVVLMDPDRPLPPPVERIRADVPSDLKALSILTDVVDCFLRFLGAALHRAGTLDEREFWEAVGDTVATYQRAHPHLSDRFAEHDLFADTFALSCLNRLQLRDPRQMVDLQDPAGSLAFAGDLQNPLARALLSQRTG